MSGKLLEYKKPSVS